MKNENLVPKVRFKGFSDPWEQRKLKLLADFSKGAGYSKKDIIDQGTPIVLYGRLYTNYQVNITTIKDTFVKVRPGSVFSECNDVIVPASGETAEDIARASHVCISGAVLGGDLNIIKPKINIIDSSFLALCISNGQQNKELIKRAQGKSIVHLHNSDLKQVVLKYPSKRNQSMIARIFDKTDNLIAANEDKLEQLKTLKKLMMQKIFSQEWRFKGFTDPWEQRKLKEITSVIKDGTHIEHYGAYLLSAKNILSNRIVYSKNDRQISINDFNKIYKGYSLNDGDFLLTIVGTIGRTAIYRQSKDKIAFQRSVAIIRGKEEIIDNYFLMFSFQLPTIKKILQRVTSISAQPGIYLRDLSNIEVWYPVISEQQKIIALLKNICNLIAANEDKLNQLKKLKKYLMQNMFV